MKRFTMAGALALIVAALLGGTFTEAMAQAETISMPIPVKFRTTSTGTAVYTDGVTWAAATQRRDTTAAMDARRLAADYQALTTGSGSLSNIARLNLVCTGLANVDSFFTIVQGSPDGVNWVLTGTEISSALPSYLGSTNVLSVLLNLNPISNSGGNVFLHPYWRFIIRPDGNTAATGVVTNCYVTIPTSVAVGSLDAPRGDLKY